MVEKAEYEESVIDLFPGDRLYLHSDGLNEQADQDGNEFGRQRMLEVLDNCRDAALDVSVSSLVNSVAAWKGDDHFKDDVAILAVEMSDSCPPERLI